MREVTEKTVNGQGYIPYRRDGKFVPSWRGLVDLVARAGRASVWASVVPPADAPAGAPAEDSLNGVRDAITAEDRRDAARWRWIRAHWVEVVLVHEGGLLPAQSLICEGDAAIGDNADALRLDMAVDEGIANSERITKRITR